MPDSARPRPADREWDPGTGSRTSVASPFYPTLGSRVDPTPPVARLPVAGGTSRCRRCRHPSRRAIDGAAWRRERDRVHRSWRRHVDRRSTCWVSCPAASATRRAREVVVRLRGEFGEAVLDPPVREAHHLSEAPRCGSRSPCTLRAAPWRTITAASPQSCSIASVIFEVAIDRAVSRAALHRLVGSILGRPAAEDPLDLAQEQELLSAAFRSTPWLQIPTGGSARSRRRTSVYGQRPARASSYAPSARPIQPKSARVARRKTLRPRAEAGPTTDRSGPERRRATPTHPRMPKHRRTCSCERGQRHRDRG